MPHDFYVVLCFRNIGKSYRKGRDFQRENFQRTSLTQLEAEMEAEREKERLLSEAILAEEQRKKEEEAAEKAKAAQAEEDRKAALEQGLFSTMTYHVSNAASSAVEATQKMGSDALQALQDAGNTGLSFFDPEKYAFILGDGEDYTVTTELDRMQANSAGIVPDHIFGNTELFFSSGIVPHPASIILAMMRTWVLMIFASARKS